MPEKVVGAPTEVTPPKSTPPAAAQLTTVATPTLNAPSHDDGVTNPRDGRGPLRRRDDQAAKLPLRPPH